MHTARIFLAPALAPTCGQWYDVDADTDAAELEAEAIAYTRANHADIGIWDKLDITDTEDCGDAKTIASAIAFCAYIDACDKLGVDIAAAIAYAANEGGSNLPDASACADAYIGKFGPGPAGVYWSHAELAEEFVESTGMLDGVHEHIANYFDYEAYGRDLVLGGDVWESGGYYFWNR